MQECLACNEWVLLECPLGTDKGAPRGAVVGLLFFWPTTLM